jgi:hypothetical protein
VASTVPVFSGERLLGGETSLAAVPDAGYEHGVLGAVDEVGAVVDESLAAGPLGRLAPGELSLELALGRVSTLLIGGHALVLPHSLGWPARKVDHPDRESR